ncbi:MAG: signal recognition particle-docking protein FtsY [Pseudomonadota bacterium]
MSEKRGFLSGLFGRGKKTKPKDEPLIEAEAPVETDAPDDSAPELTPEPMDAPEDEPFAQDGDTDFQIVDQAADAEDALYDMYVEETDVSPETEVAAPSPDTAASTPSSDNGAPAIEPPYEKPTAFEANEAEPTDPHTKTLDDLRDAGAELRDLQEGLKRQEEAEAPLVNADSQEDSEPAPQKKGFFSRLKEGLSKSTAKLADGVAGIFAKAKLDDDTLEELEDLLITADLGVAAASRVAEALAKDRYDKDISDAEVRAVLAEEVAKTLEPLERSLSVSADLKPHVILMTGVNGAGKTTTIGKLAQKFKAEGKSVMLAAGDTFRAAAIEQLQVWGERVGAQVIAKNVGADAAGLAYDALEAAKAQGVDVLMIDTAGRLQNKRELMDELAKVVRVIKKLDPDAPHDAVLVLDATVGQNALSQVEVFKDVAGVTGLIMTKLDGTARGGVLVALADRFALPIHYIGVGEQAEDLQAFDAQAFSKALAGADA